MVACNRLNPMDATLLYLESPMYSSTIGLICRFEGPLAFDAYVQDFRCRRIEKLQRFRQVIVPVPFTLAHPSWEDDPGFCLDKHLRHVRLEHPGSEEQLREVSNRVLEERFDFTRSPWNIVFVDGLHDGTCVLIFHMHHSITDGMGFLKILQAVFDEGPEPFVTTGSGTGLATPRQLPGAFERTRAAFREWFANRSRSRRGGETALEAKERKLREKKQLLAFNSAMKELFTAKGIHLPFNAPLSGRIHHSSVVFDLDELRGIARAVPCTVNDVLLAVLAGAIDRLAHELALDVSGTCCRVYQAANTRAAHDAESWGNRLSFIPALLPLGLRDPRERLCAISAYTRKTKENGVREAADRIIRTFQAATPPPLAKLGVRVAFSQFAQALGRLNKRPPVFNLYMSNVRLPQFNTFLGGKRMTELVGLAPLVPNTGLTLTAAAFDKCVSVGILADAVSLPDVDGFAAKLTAAYLELRSGLHQEAVSTP
ncbi:MAG: WS/DGAT domain-containing protein [Candidatus Hydrogenedentes bacterium]|nr:WS/DGAT domain-containing protein [Candidatus Hydrogenedentota bacterium]